MFVLFINVGIILRAILGSVKRGLKVFHMPLFDALILLLTLWGIKNFWVEEVKNMLPIHPKSVYVTFPVYIALWLISLYFNGAYDQPYRALKVTRGMLIGTTAILAYYGLLPPEFRYSRAIIIFTGFGGTVILLGLHEIVADEPAYKQTASILRQVHYAPELSGRISPKDEKHGVLATLPEMKQVLYTTGVNEVIFCINGLSYADVFEQMQHCGKEYEYKIHLIGSQSFVGSNSSSTSGDLYTIDRRFNLADFAQVRNKRFVDIAASLLFIILFPFTFFLVKRPGQFFANCFKVLSGKLAWVGYATDVNTNFLPRVRQGAIQPYNILAGYSPTTEVRTQINNDYAQHYTAFTDIALILKNYKYLGGL
jgi:hypothetical protein